MEIENRGRESLLWRRRFLWIWGETSSLSVCEDSGVVGFAIFFWCTCSVKSTNSRTLSVSGVSTVLPKLEGEDSEWSDWPESPRENDFLAVLSSNSSYIPSRVCTLRYCGEHDEKEPNNGDSSVSSVSSPMSWLYLSIRAGKKHNTVVVVYIYHDIRWISGKIFYLKGRNENIYMR